MYVVILLKCERCHTLYNCGRCLSLVQATSMIDQLCEFMPQCEVCLWRGTLGREEEGDPSQDQD